MNTKSAKEVFDIIHKECFMVDKKDMVTINYIAENSKTFAAEIAAKIGVEMQPAMSFGGTIKGKTLYSTYKPTGAQKWVLAYEYIKLKNIENK